jgi:hypothetical protein
MRISASSAKIGGPVCSMADFMILDSPFVERSASLAATCVVGAVIVSTTERPIASAPNAAYSRAVSMSDRFWSNRPYDAPFTLVPPSYKEWLEREGFFE